MKELEKLAKEVNPKIFNAALSLYFDPDYCSGKNKREIKEKRAKILHAARIVQETNFPSESDAFMKVLYWSDAYIYDGVNVLAIQECINSLDKQIVKELDGEDAYEILCVECESHDKCHLRE